MTLNSRTCLLVLLIPFFSCKDQPQEQPSRESFIDQELFKDHIRITDYQTPEQEMAGFHLPPGFEINLYASEPDITKPINMEFDDRGRLWVTHSIEYPMEAAPGSGKDKITILEDTDGDGKADKFTDFASDLNIPIGIMPVKGGAIAYSIPNVYMFSDIDGDDKYDEKKVLLGPFGHVDTHGMINNFMRAPDGWIHSSHGFRNSSTVAGADGDSISMTSGNTFRFRIDGSRAEQTTYGRVNPFGFAFDDLGYLYSADCHSMPIYQIINQGDYPHFGKKPSGLGFGPPMMDYQIGSTALSGLVYYNAGAFPEEYRNSFYSGDVVASRVSRNTLTFNGSSPQSVPAEDFLLSEDPWFRPVDIKIGPDGAMYIADFYNRIIGHYEVPLSHPGRDRTSGRIWRITYKGKTTAPTDWSRVTPDELLAGLGHSAFNMRMAASNRLVDYHASAAIGPVRKLIGDPTSSPKQIVHGLWVLHRLGALTAPELIQFASGENQEVRVHAYRILVEFPQLTEDLRKLAAGGINHTDPHTRRAAADVLVRHNDVSTLRPLAAAVASVPENDTHLRYTLLIALREHLKNDRILASAVGQEWAAQEAKVLMDAATEVNSAVASSFIFENLKKYQHSNDRTLVYLERVGRFAPDEQLAEAIAFAREKFAGDPESQYRLYNSIHAGIAQRGGSALRTPMKNWAASFAGEFLKNLETKPELVADGPSAHADESWEHFNEISERQIFAANFARENKLNDYEQGLKDLLNARWARDNSRAAAAFALVELSLSANLARVEAKLNDPEEAATFREELARAVGASRQAAVQAMLVRAIKEAPSGLQLAIGSALVNSDKGRKDLLQLVDEGFVSPRVLADRKISEQLIPRLTGAQKADYDRLTANLESVLEQRQKLIDLRLASYDPRPDVVLGKSVFAEKCGICHQINNSGGLIGPQLDGIGNWGRKALVEKVIDPNRNISQAFRNYVITLSDGKTVSGLYRRDEGGVEVYANAAGQEFTVAKAEIKEKKASQYTLMPDNFGETIGEREFDALLAYLLTQK